MSDQPIQARSGAGRAAGLGRGLPAALLPLLTLAAAVLACANRPAARSNGVAARPPTSNLITSLETVLDRGAGRLDWSWAHDRIVLDRRGLDGFYDVWTMTPDGGDQRCLSCDVPGLPEGQNGQPEWHPSGDWVVFQSEAPRLEIPPRFQARQRWITGPGAGVNNNLWIMSRDGRQAYQLTSIRSMEASLHPHFNHDGSELIWAAIGQDPPRSARWAIRKADFGFEPDGRPRIKNTQTLSPAQADFYETHGFTPDGGHILFSANIGRGRQFDMDQWLFDLSTGALTQLTDSPSVWDEHGHISPSGGHVVWASSKGYEIDTDTWHSGGGWERDLVLELWIMEADGSNPQQLTFFNRPDESGSTPEVQLNPADSAWNRDGDELMVLVSVRDWESGSYRSPRMMRLEFPRPF